MRAGIIALGFLALSSSASAQMIVFGSGLGRQCYEAAETSRMSAREAIDICSDALGHEAMSRNDRVSTLVNRGILYMRNGDFERSMADYNAALEMDPENGEAYLNVGAAYIYQREYEPARDALNRAIELNSADLWAAYYNRAITYEQTGDLTSAYWDFRRALEINPDFELAARQISRFTVEEIPAEPES